MSKQVLSLDNVHKSIKNKEKELEMKKDLVFLVILLIAGRVNLQRKLK